MILAFRLAILLRLQVQAVMQLQMRIHDRALLEKLVHRKPAANVGGFHLDRDAGAVPVFDRFAGLAVFADWTEGGDPIHFFVHEDGRLVSARINLHLHPVRLLVAFRLRKYPGGGSGGELAVHPRGADADALLTARHAQAVKFRAIQELGENLRDLLPHNARPVVRDTHAEPVVRDLLNIHADFRQDAAFLARVQRVVHRLFHGGEQRLARAVEAE